MKKRLSEYNTVLYNIAVFKNRVQRYIKWWFGREKYSKNISKDYYKFKVKRHQSLLLRTLGNVDKQLQINKIVNLSLGINKIDGVIIKPGEIFSLCKLLGNCTKKKGYKEGLVISNGEAKISYGGGMCQLANLIHWMVLHSPLDIIERHHHSLDLFPDSGRQVPFGTGASIFYNYLDYQFKNNTNVHFQLKIWVTDKHIKGELLSSEELLYSYHIYEKNHRFIKKDNVFYRENEIWKSKIDKLTGNIVSEQQIYHNIAKVIYDESFIAEYQEIL